jgi:outer membrane protein TolC
MRTSRHPAAPGLYTGAFLLVTALSLSGVLAQPGTGRAPAAPSPSPLYTLPPASQPTSLPYPAYGTPVPGVGAGAPAPGVPQKVTVQQAIEIGYARSPLLASARADVGVAAALERLARAGFLPSVAGSASSTRTHLQQGGSGGAGSAAGGGTGGSASTGPITVTSNSLSANVKQLIFDGGRVAAGVHAAQRNETAFADAYRRDLQTTAFNVATAYYNYLLAQRTTAVDVELVRENQTQVDLVSAQLRAGTASRVDVVTAQLPLAQTRVAVVRAQGVELAAQASFANAMGLDADVDVQPIDDAPVSTTGQVVALAIPTYAQAIARAIALRPDYDASRQSLESAQFSLKQARLGLFPSLGASGQAGTASSDPGGGSYRNSSSIGIALTIPLFDQGITAANSAQAQANLDKAAAGLQNTKLGIQLNVKQALTNLVSAQAALDQARVELTNAMEVLRSTQAQYRAGVTTLPLLLNAQVGMTQALTDRVNTIYNLRLAEQAFLYATGAIGQT